MFCCFIDVYKYTYVYNAYVYIYIYISFHVTCTLHATSPKQFETLIFRFQIIGPTTHINKQRCGVTVFFHQLGLVKRQIMPNFVGFAS